MAFLDPLKTVFDLFRKNGSAKSVKNGVLGHQKRVLKIQKKEK